MTINTEAEVIVDANALAWVEGVAGIKIKHLVSRPGGPHARVIRMEPGMVVPRHRHPCCEIMYVLDGELEMNGETYGAGICYFKPEKLAYGPLSTTTGVTLLLFFDGNDNFMA